MKKTGLVLLVLLLAGSILPGEEWAIIGARQLGMGGAGVASAKGGAAYYWNPALYAVHHTYDMQLPLGTGLALEGNLIDNADFLGERIQTLDWEAIQDTFNNSPGTVTINDFQGAFEIMLIDIPPLADYGTGITANATIGGEIQFGNYGCSLLGIAYGGAHPVINLTSSSGVAMSDDSFEFALMALGGTYADHMGDLSAAGVTMANQFMTDFGISGDTASTFVWLAETTPANPNGDTVDLTNPTTYSILEAIGNATFDNDAGGTNSLMLDNQSGVDLGLIATREVAFTASRAFMGGFVAFGVNFKGVIADTLQMSITVSDMEDGEAIASEAAAFHLNEVTSSRLAFDVGMIVSLTDALNLGMTVRNLNQPTFEFEGESNGYTLYSQTRVGVAYQVNDNLLVAADMDLFPNLSEVISGLKTQFLAGGLEWTPVSWWALQAGIYKNLAVGEGLVYTAGMGFKIWRTRLDLAGSLGFSDVKVDVDRVGFDVYVPERGNFMISFGLDIEF